MATSLTMQRLMTESKVQPFSIHIPDRVLEDLRERLGRTRWPDEVTGAEWNYGTDLTFMRRFADYWGNQFDWRAQETAINRHPQFVAEVDGERLHFFHAEGEGDNRVPILLANGWPSNFYELLPLIPRLIRKRDGFSFDVVVVSLPGFGFSDRPRKPGMNVSRIGELFGGLMTLIGYDRFMTHGSDMGAGALQMTAIQFPDRVTAVHQCNVYWNLPRPEKPSKAEEDYAKRGEAWAMQEGAYGMLQSTKPQSLAFGLNDSPVGMAAWILEKFRTWSDCEGDLEKVYSLDTLCTLVTIYWVTETIGSSVRLYAEVARDPRMHLMAEKTKAPVAVAMFPKDLVPAPKEFAQRWHNLKRFTEMSRGGHFAALEVPDLLANDIREFAREVYSR